jgi:DNA-binding winged helix-turn-helix (wHTH) protein
VRERFIVFPPFQLDVVDERLRQGGQVVELRPKTFAVLHHLLQHAGRLVTKGDLLDTVWPDVAVTESVLKGCIAEIRAALGDDRESPRFVETAHRRGYRFIGAVTRRPGDRPTAAAASAVFGREDALNRLDEAFATAGTGARQVVFVTGEPGIGKTTLVDRWLDRVGDQHASRIGPGECLEHCGAAEAYLPILDAVGRLCRDQGGEQIVGVLRRYAPTWLAQLPALLGDVEREELARQLVGATPQRMLREMAEALEAITATAPLVLVVEDLHWSDRSTLDLVAMLARRRETAKLPLGRGVLPRRCGGDALAMGRHYLILALVLVLGSLAQAAHLPGEGGIAALTQGGVPVCGGENDLELNPGSFACSCTAQGILCSAYTPIYITATPGVDCTGKTDSTTGVQNALNAVAAGASKTLFVPAGCVPRFASPAANNTFCTGSGAPLACCSGAGAGTCYGPSIAMPAGVHIVCEDNSAGFAVQRQRCTGGTYPDAACNTDAECLGGGTCDNDFGTASVNPCDATTCYAPTSTNTYIMFRDAANGTDISITGCSFFAAQADPYQRCAGGTNAGDPCRQECTGGSIPGLRCETNGNCIGGGTCLRTADCHDVGGTCGGAPHASAGLGKIDVLDLQRTTYVTLRDVKVRDQLSGEFTLKTSYNALLTDTDLAAEGTNCTSPLATPTDSGCFFGTSGTCCYGAGAFGSSNVQPTTAVTNGVTVGTGSKLTRVRARGSTAAFNVQANNAVVENCDAVPAVTQGPGTAGGGIVILANGVVANSRVQNPAAGATAITLGADSSAIANEIAGTYTTAISATGAGAHVIGNTIAGTYTTGISLTAARQTAIGNTLTGLQTSGTGINSTGDNTSIGFNYIEGNGTSATAIHFGGTGTKTVVEGNHIESNAVDNLKNGIVAENGGDSSVISGNTINRVHDVAIWLKSNLSNGIRVADNTTMLTPAYPTAALQPTHYRLDDGGTSGPTQLTIATAYASGGFRGLWSAGRTGGLVNTNITGGRWMGLSGATLNLGGAGIKFDNNYVNQSGRAAGALICDASCTNRGTFCTQDSDCTRCAASVQKCIPEAIAGYWESPTAISGGSAHPGWINNLLFADGQNPVLQCFGSTPSYPGAVCHITEATCVSGGGTCAGGPPSTCTGGSQNGKYCCAVASGTPTCAVRGLTPYVRFLDYNVADGGISDAFFDGNNMFPSGANNNLVGLDFVSTGDLGHVTVNRLHVGANNFSGGGGSATTAIRLPTSPATMVDVNLVGNTFSGWTTDLANFKGVYGDVNFLMKTIALPTDQTLTATTFTDVTTATTPVQVALKANRRYYFNCEPTFSSAALTTGVAFSVNYSGTFATMTFICRLPTPAIETGAGTDTMTEQEGNANDECATPSLGVGATGVKYMANVRGNIVTTGAGNLTLRALRSSTAGNITVYAGTNCQVTQMP